MRELASEGLWKLSCAAIGIPVAGWLGALLVARLLERAQWLGAGQATSISVLAMLCVPLHGLVLMGCSSFGRGLAELTGEVAWRSIAAIVATSAPVFVAIVTTNLVLGGGELSFLQASIGAVAAHVALLCALPLLGSSGSRL